MNQEELFYKNLRELLIGTKAEGKGGFIELIKTKSEYYNKLEKLIKSDIEKALKEHPSLKNKLFKIIYSFFNKHIAENGSIYSKETYSDPLLFIKTQQLYYIKTDKLFKSKLIEINDIKILFDASTIENKKNNEKRTLTYKLKEIKEDKTVIFNIYYEEKPKTTNTKEIIEKLQTHSIHLKEEDLKKAFKTFEKEPELDFFLNKEVESFLKEQFNKYICQELLKNNKKLDQSETAQIQTLKEITHKIIEFIARFEEKIIKIWNKPKQIKNINYVITLNKLEAFGEKGIEIIRKLLNHENIGKQIEEWKELNIVDKKFSIENTVKINLSEKYLPKEYKFLPIDTKYFKDLEKDILSLFNNLEDALDGWLIKSESYQALNTLLPKFKGKVKTIYIDPPFNLKSDQLHYKTNYKDSTWAVFIENRLKLAKEWLNKEGNIFIRCDYNGNWIIRYIANEIFGKENFRNEIIVKRGAPKAGLLSQFKNIKSMANAYDNLYWYSKNKETRFPGFYKEADEKRKTSGFWTDFQKGEAYNRPTMRYEILGINIDKGQWKWSKERAYKAVENYLKYLEVSKETGETLEEYWERTGKQLEFIKREGNKIKYWVHPREKLLTDNNWLDIPGYSSTWNFQTENSEALLKRIIKSTSNEDDLIMDFFLGSGTTIAVAHKLKRKWIGIEMGEHFYTVILPRMKKVITYDKSGISKEKDVKEKYNKENAGGFFVYFELEQFEEALSNAISDITKDLNKTIT
ncbi:MAG: site-specific DNA-methyltransferase [Sulfurihydrogenibium sp.]|nr:site-specific DNA-methyltransferase [Sulfurihydrogenibium sp.]